MNKILINETELQVKEYNGQRVVTLADVDFVHKRPSGTAKKNFQNNRKHLILNEDYFEITRKTFKPREYTSPRKFIIV